MLRADPMAATHAHDFSRRTFSLWRFLASIGWITAHLIRVARVHAGSRVSTPALREAIWLAVTEVNGCRYCAYVHESMADGSGLSEAEVHLLLSTGDPRALESVATLSPAERRLVAWSKAWADARGTGTTAPPLHRDAPLRGPDLDALLRTVELGNLSGNTLDSLLHRFGHPRRLLQPLGLASDLVVGLLVSLFGWPALAAAGLRRLSRPRRSASP